MFRNRVSAGIVLSAKLGKYAREDGIVLAIPRGGVPVAYPVAKSFGFPIDLVLTKKLGHPQNKEYAIGAASLTDYFVIPHEGVSMDYIEEELAEVRSRLKVMQELFHGDREPIKLAGKTLLVIDDGIATGNTILTTIQLLRNSHPAKLVIAVPVASVTAVKKLSAEADDIIVLLQPEEFRGVGAFYEDFGQVSDEEVIFYMTEIRSRNYAGQ